MIRPQINAEQNRNSRLVCELNSAIFGVPVPLEKQIEELKME